MFSVASSNLQITLALCLNCSSLFLRLNLGMSLELIMELIFAEIHLKHFVYHLSAK